MKLMIVAVAIMLLSIKIKKIEDDLKLTKEQNEILTTYCKALPECKKEMER